MVAKIDESLEKSVSLGEEVVTGLCCTDLRVAFSMFDKDGDGHISVQEVHDSMMSLGFNIELSRVKLMVRHVDTDGRCTTFRLSALHVPLVFSSLLRIRPTPLNRSWKKNRILPRVGFLEY